MWLRASEVGTALNYWNCCIGCYWFYPFIKTGVGIVCSVWQGRYSEQCSRQYRRKNTTITTKQGILPTFVHFCGENTYQVLLELQRKIFQRHWWPSSTERCWIHFLCCFPSKRPSQALVSWTLCDISHAFSSLLISDFRKILYVILFTPTCDCYKEITQGEWDLIMTAGKNPPNT